MNVPLFFPDPYSTLGYPPPSYPEPTPQQLWLITCYVSTANLIPVNPHSLYPFATEEEELPALIPLWGEPVSDVVLRVRQLYSLIATRKVPKAVLLMHREAVHRARTEVQLYNAKVWIALRNQQDIRAALAAAHAARSPSSFAPYPSAPSSIAPVQSAPSSFAPMPSTTSPFAPLPSAPSSFAPLQLAPSSFAPIPSAPSTFVPLQTAPSLFAPSASSQTSFAPNPAAPISLAPAHFAPNAFE